MSIIEAREFSHQGRQQPLTPQGNEDAKEFYRKAISDEGDPKYAVAYAEYSYVWLRARENRWGDPDEALLEARKLADKAVELSNETGNSSQGDFRPLWYRAMVSWHEGDFARSFGEYKAARALITNPEFIDKNTSDLEADMAEAMIYFGEPSQALHLVLGAMNRYVIDFPWWFRWIAARAYYQLGRYQEAIDEIAKIDPAKKPNDVRLIVAASQAQLGKTSEANATMQAFRAIEPDWTLDMSEAYPYGNPAVRAHWIDGLEKAGLPRSGVQI